MDVAVADLLAEPEGKRDRQLLYGDVVTILGLAGSHAYVRSEKDSHHGYVLRSALGDPHDATHRVTAPATHAYSEANLKSPERTWLSFGSRVRGTGTVGKFLETPAGFVPTQHVAPVDLTGPDPVAVAQLFLGTPYLWGGNSRAGIDCSGLVQAALLACGMPCPGDSDQQMAEVGEALPDGTPYRAGDLLFWKGHVAFVFGENRLLHANAHHMAVAFEDLGAALRRIEEQGDGPLLAHKRI